MISLVAARIFGAAIISPGLRLLLLSAAPVMAQQAAPEIPFESVPDPLKLPDDLYFGEVAGVAVNSKGHVFVFSRGNTTGPPMRRPPRNCSSSTTTASSSARSARTCTPGRSRTPCASTRTTISGSIDKGSDMVVKFNPAGTRDDGVRAQAGSLRRRNRAAGASESAAARRGRPVPPADRRRPGIRTATSTSATATSIRASPKPTRTATG